MGIKESALSVIASLTDSDFIRAVTAAGESRKIKATGVGKYAVETYSGSTLAGSAQSVQSAVGGLKNDVTTMQGDIAMLNTNLINKLKKSLIVGTASGSVASFNNGSDIFPALKCVAKIEPNQDLHGYGKPWVGGGGVNLFEPFSGTSRGIDFTPQSDGSVKISGTVSSNGWISTYKEYPITDFGLSVGDSVFIHSNGKTSDDGHFMTMVRFYDSSSTQLKQISGEATTTVPNNATKVRLYYYGFGPSTPQQGTVVNDVGYFEFGKGSTIPTKWTPYENICPISGWSGVDVDVNGTTTAVSWSGDAGTVYGGTIDLVSGVLTVTHTSITLTDFSAWGYQTTNHYKALLKRADQIGIPMPNTSSGARSSVICSAFNNELDGRDKPYGTFSLYASNDGTFYFWNNDDVASDKNDMISRLEAIQPQIVYELATPITYTLTAQQVDILLGDNIIFANTGPMDPVEYYADATITIQNLS